MNSVEEHINNINTKLQILLKKYTALKKENQFLTDEIHKLKDNEGDHLKKIDALEIQNNILKASAGKMSNEEKIDFEKRIKVYIKDIDKCMEMLNN